MATPAESRPERKIESEGGDGLPYNRCVVHYAEIGTKAGNRWMFENALARNVSRAVRPWIKVNVRRETGRLTFPLADAAPADLPDLLAAVVRQPGVAWVSPAVRTRPVLAKIEAVTVALSRKRHGSFKINARRSVKSLPFDSMEVNRVVGAAVQAATGRPVDVHHPDDEYRVEADDKYAYVLDARRNGPGGLPVGTAGTVVTLLSGGLDSPVAAYRMMVRGCHVIGVHLWNRAYSGEGVREKVIGLAEVLARYHGPLRIELVPFDELQQEIVAFAPADLRMLLYRRAMLRVANIVREQQGAHATVTGDAVGQVASQTLQNLSAVYAAANPPVLAPLCGTNKADIVRTAREIGTYDESVKPGVDCCSLLVAKHPKTATTAARLADVESEYDLDALCADALSRREVHLAGK